MKTLTHDEIVNLALAQADDDNSIYMRKGEYWVSVLRPGPWDMRFAHLFATSAVLYSMADQCVEALDACLEILEADGHNQEAAEIQTLTAAVRLTTQIAIMGPNEAIRRGMSSGEEEAKKSSDKKWFWRKK